MGWGPQKGDRKKKYRKKRKKSMPGSGLKKDLAPISAILGLLGSARPKKVRILKTGPPPPFPNPKMGSQKYYALPFYS